MCPNTMQDDPGGFRLLAGSISGAEGDAEVAEAFVEAPDGTTCHVTRVGSRSITFEAVPVNDYADGPNKLTEREADELKELFPDLAVSAEQHRAFEPETFDRWFPDIKRQWEAWRVEPSD
jgi:hypothetical protein